MGHDDHGDHSHGDDDHGEHSHGDDGHGHDDHAHDDHHGHDEDAVSIAVVTVSSSRTLDDDPGGDTIETVLTEAGHEVERSLVTDDPVAIADGVTGALEDGADAVVTTGGTGLTPDDVTVDAVAPLFDREIPGFGELFRYLSYEEVGAMAMASRATAGVVADRLVFCLPGSENAARTGADLVAPAVGHLLGLVRR